VRQNAYNMEEKEQTAVEWLYDQMTATWFDKVSGTDILKAAKELEKDQIINSYWDGCRNWDNEKEAEQYYNETYGDDT